MYTIAKDLNRYKPVFSFAKVLSRQTLSILRTLFFTISIISGVVASGFALGLPGDYLNIALGVCLISTALWLEQILIYSYYNSFYFHGLNSILGIDREDISGTTYEVAQVLLKKESDTAFAFCTSQIGTEILLRAGITQNALDTFLLGSRQKISTDMIPLPEKEVFTLISLGKYLLQQDSAFKDFIKSQGITETIFLGALNWVVNAHHQEKKLSRWWSKDNLSKTKGIGREWSYGTPYLLEKYSRDISTSAVFSTLTNSNHAFAEEKLAEVEVALARAKAANVLLIGEAGVGKIDLLLAVEKRLQAGTSIGAVEDQRMIVLDTNRLFATQKSKQEFEYTLISLFTEAHNAGNIIIVIENLSNFIREGQALGVFIPEVIDEFLASPALHVVATDTPSAYHNYLEPLGAFSRRFAEVLIDAPDLSSTTKVLEGVALKNERKYRILFTYPALVAITSAADRYLVEGAMPDKAIELLIDIATRASQSKQGTVDANYVYTIVSEKTGIPTGPIGESERDLLLNLETKLHEKVIGQQKALDAIARTMRRARADIQASDRPIGSFLFLGPTGVGKTETAKALASVFFGDENNMHRLDMSEFSGTDALSKLIGDSQEAGVLSSMLHDNPYSVLLLDEFEKGSKAVHDLFLQILDEGIFTNSRGEKVNARNTIIIATSNAGSKLIQETVNQRQELATLAAEIINHVIKSGIYRPELINRFDNTIIFEPLKVEEQGQIASLMLKDLYERVKAKGYELTINRELMDLLVKKGYSLEFGVRPMKRVLQDIVEEKIAQKIISGSIKTGDSIELSKEDFSEKELSV